MPQLVNRLGNVEDNLPSDEEFKELATNLVTIQHTQVREDFIHLVTYKRWNKNPKKWNIMIHVDLSNSNFNVILLFHISSKLFIPHAPALWKGTLMNFAHGCQWGGCLTFIWIKELTYSSRMSFFRMTSSSASTIKEFILRLLLDCYVFCLLAENSH
jgi:hypothetical protein